MEEPLTEDMLAELLDAPDPRAFIKRREVGERSLAEYLGRPSAREGAEALSGGERGRYQRDLRLPDFHRRSARLAGNNLLKLAFAMGCSLRETNRLLQAGGANELYCKNRRDAIVIFAISHGYTLQKTEEELYRFGEATIS